MNNNSLANLILGIKDYSKDCWHDWLYSKLRDVDSDAQAWLWKEGDLKHYIRQRKISMKSKTKTYIIGITLKNHTRYISKTTVTKKYKDLHLIEKDSINFNKQVLMIHNKFKASTIVWLLNHSYRPLYNLRSKFLVKEFKVNKK